jgi:hypothetical protein
MNSTHNDVCEQIKAEARSKAVFTESQIDQIVKINVALQNVLIVSINDLKKKLECISDHREIERLEKAVDAMTCALSHLTTEVSHIEEVNAKQTCNIDKLFEYANTNSQIIAKLRAEMKDDTVQIHHLECEMNKLEKVVKCIELKEFRDGRVDNLIKKLQCFLTRTEMDKILARLAFLETKEYRDERIEKIIACLDKFETKKEVEELIKRIACLEAKEYRDERIEKIIACLDKFETKKEVEELIKRILCLEKRKLVDDRFDQVMHELCEMRKEIDTMRRVNCEQNKIINELNTENHKQEKEIECLNNMLKRNTLVLSNEIQEVEKHVTAEEKVDLNQNANIKFLQSEIVELKHQVERMLKANLVKKCDC